MDLDDSNPNICLLLGNPGSYIQSFYEDQETGQNKKRASTAIIDKAKDPVPRRFTNEVDRASIHKNIRDQEMGNDCCGLQPKKGILKDEQRKNSNTKIRKLTFSKEIRTIKEEQNRRQEEGQFLGTILSSTQDSGEDIQEDKKGINCEGSFHKNFPRKSIDRSESQSKFKDDLSRKNSEFAGPRSRKRSVFSSKQYLENLEDLTASLLVSRSEGELDFEVPEKIDIQIDQFVDKLPRKKDRADFKNILRSKFARMKTITPKKVKTYLSRLEKMMQSNPEIANNIMDKKVDIDFVEIPMNINAVDIASSETSVMNFVRDVTWAPLTYHQVDLFRDDDDSDIITQTATQFVISMLAMIIGAVLYHIIKGIIAPPKDSKDIESNWTKAVKTLFIWLGAGLSIPGWNALQLIGHNIGVHMGLSVFNSGYFSSLFPGIPEGLTQGVISVISANTVNHTWNKFRLKTFLKQLVIFVTFGAVPGDIWQTVYEIITGPLETAENLPDWAITLILGLSLAIAVYLCNVAFGTGFERLINKSHLIIALEAVAESVELNLQDAMDNQNLASYNGRAGAPRRRPTVVVVRRDTNRSRGRSEV